MEVAFAEQFGLKQSFPASGVLIAIAVCAVGRTVRVSSPGLVFKAINSILSKATIICAGMNPHPAHGVAFARAVAAPCCLNPPGGVERHM